MPAVVPTVIAENEDFQLMHLPGASPFSLVSFGTMFSRADGRSFWGASPAASLGIDAYGVMPRGPNWYPEKNMRSICAAIRAHAEGRPLLTYGASMGAYGALRFSAELGATWTLAFSPQITIDPDQIGDRDPRYRKYFGAEIAPGHGIRPEHLAPTTVLVLDDRFAYDQAQSAMLPDTPGLHRISLPYYGHQAVQTAASSEILTQLFELLLAGRFSEMRNLLLPRRRLSAYYFEHLGHAAVRHRRPGLARQIYAEGMRRFPQEHGKLNLHAAKSFLQSGDRASARALLDSLAAAKTRDVRIHILRAKLCLEDGEPAQALLCLSEAPQHHRAFLPVEADALEALGHHDLAILSVQSILTHQPNHPAHLARIERLRAEAENKSDGSSGDSFGTCAHNR